MVESTHPLRLSRMESKADAMPKTRDEESGKYTQSYPREEFIEAIEDSGGMASTTDVSDHVGCSYDLAYKRLREFEDNGEVESRKIANSRLWMIGESDEGDDSDREETNQDESEESDGEEDSESTGTWMDEIDG